MKLDKLIDNWKKKLLDLGKRNRLINFKPESKSVLHLTKPSLDVLWSKIIEKNGSIKFPYIPDKDEPDEEEIVLPEYKFGEVSTDRKPRDAQRILRRLRKNYKTIAEEQDVNVLYLTFGILEWKESQNSRQKLYSPLLLVPVSLEQQTINSPIVLEATDDEIVLNPTLVYKLKQDCGIVLPEFDDDCFAIIEAIKKIAQKNSWIVKEDIYISILSFLKINMYKDIERHKDSIMKHPIIRAFTGKSEPEFDNMAQAAAEIEGFDHDSVKPKDIYQIVDADSSQQDAILCANKEISFILQGPPGTGKSQTITNIIASRLAAGKKVLFVSEKKAALEVVYKRLKEAGLSDFILPLHSSKANKKVILSQLENVLLLSRNIASLSDSVKYELDKLMKDRNILNAYARQVNEIIQPLNKSIFYANGIISKYSDIEDISFSIPSVRATTEEKFRDYISALEQLSRGLKTMNEDCLSNPWRNTVIPHMTHEFIHDLKEKKESIQKACDKFNSFFEDIKTILKINIDSYTFDTAEKILSLLKVAARSPEVPLAWLNEKTINGIEKNIEEQKNIQDEYSRCVGEVNYILQQIEKIDSTIDFGIIDYSSLANVKEFISSIETIIKDDLCSFDGSSYNLGLINANEKIVKKYNEINNKILSEYKSDIFDIDIASIKLRYENNYTSIIKYFKSSYWEDQKLLKSLLLNKYDKKTIIDTKSLFENINYRTQLLKELDNQEAEMAGLFPRLYKKENTDFPAIHRKIDTFYLLNECINKCKKIVVTLEELEVKKSELAEKYGDRFIGIRTIWSDIQNALIWFNEFIANCKNINGPTSEFILKVCTDKYFIGILEKNISNIENLLNIYKDDFIWFAQKFDNAEEILSWEFNLIKDKVISCADNIHDLENWIDYKSAREDVIRLGIAEYLQIIENKPIKSINIIQIFEKRFYRLWLDSVSAEYPAVVKFRHLTHEEVIKEFSQLDKYQFEIARKRIKAELINSLPAFDTFMSGEVNILRRELAKQRRIMPIRKLFSNIPSLLPTLKPCLMMSPLSVSQFLESENYIFDTVIFDEASQVKTENAIGAIFRGKQVIIAGDSKQLPPTNFFEVTTSGSEFDTEEADEDDEPLDASILEEAMFLPSKELLWHYRSKHENLIAFSNRKIYQNRLITFPSSTEEAPDWGVEYIYVENGVYNGRGNSRGNNLEAERVADEVFKHIKTHPERTLGVIAFGVVQELAIESAINKKRQENPQYEVFFAEDKHEAFFVKSLENVQGDERDTIIFSIGYAKDCSGKMAMRFGPLSMAGGERRLNVAITRAKYNIKLVGSIRPTDIDVDRVSQEGPKLLRKYIEFAMNGIAVLQNDIETSDELQFDSPFEESVYSFLDSRGYKVSTQVGCSGYRIDMAIRHPSLSGIYVLGIECDGATYHSSRTARERDRLRQDILEMMGWKIYRIWSTDWIKDNLEEKNRLLKAVENAISAYKPNFLPSHKERPIVEKKELIIVPKKQGEDTDYNFAKYSEYDINNCKRDISKGLYEMIKVEQPVHFDMICQRLCPVMGREKGTSVVQNRIKFLIRQDEGKYIKKDDFYSIAKTKNDYKVREAGNRQIKYISIDEITKGMLKILLQNIGLTKEELIRETVKLFGFKRNGENIVKRMELGIKELVSTNKISINNDKILVMNPKG